MIKHEINKIKRIRDPSSQVVHTCNNLKYPICYSQCVLVVLQGVIIYAALIYAMSFETQCVLVELRN